MSASLRDDDEEFKVGGVKGGLRSKPRFSYTEVRVLLEAVKRNRYIILRKFNQGVSAEAKKKTWAEITNQINSLGENHREVRQIMKKWADLKCDGKRRIAALRGPNGSNLRKKNLGPVEKMVHKILMMSPRGDGDSDPDDEDEALTALINNKGLLSNPPPYSYLSVTESSHSLPGGASLDFSPLSSPEKEFGDPFHSSSDFDLELDFADDGDRTMDWDENNDPSFSAQLPPSSLDPLPDNALMRVKPVYTYSRSNSQNHNHTSARPPPGPSSSTATTSSVFPAVSDSAGASSSAAAAPPPPQSPASSDVTASCLPAPSSSSSTSVAATDSAVEPVASSSSIPPPPLPTSGAVSSSPSSSGATTTSAPSTSVPAASSQKPPASSLAPPKPHSSTSGSKPSDPLPPGASFRRSQDHVAQMASQSVHQQRASRLLLTSVSHSLEILAQSVQLLVESQQEFVQESLLLQRETVDILRDFSNTALTMLRDKGNSGHTATHHPPNHPPSH